MSAAVKEDEVILCASCGTAGSDGIKLKNCTACYLVKYCSVKCQKDHRPKHKKACKKRAAELRDELLFKQPESSCYGDCPICCLPIVFDKSKSAINTCCSKIICEGCYVANQKREIEGRLQQTCPFCRKTLAKTNEEQIERAMKRIEANDPVAICDIGRRRCREGDYKAAFEYWTRAAALGDADAHHELASLYHFGHGVEKDEKKILYHTEQAAIGGHPRARHNLGTFEARKGRVDRAVKHYIIAAKLGNEKSLERAKILYESGHVTNEDFATALRGYHTAINAMKSLQREEAEALLAA